MDKDLNSESKGDTSPLTTSTESESFDTWTVITDKSKDEMQDEIQDAIEYSGLPTPERSDEDDEVDIATDAVHVEVMKASDNLNDSRYNDIDDLSDGISIISESESAGRMTPHPDLRAHLADLNIRFLNITEPPLPSTTTTTTGGSSTHSNYEACSERSSETFHRVEPLVESNRRPRRASRQLTESSSMESFHPTLRCGLRGMFYVGALLAVLAFISKVKYDSWESVIGTTTGYLTQKIDDLELKNNLMRAEIDILTKQVNYLTTLSENQKYGSFSSSSSSSKPKNNRQQSQEKKMKVWPGNGNTIEEVEISPQDLKKPFKCEGHNNVDIAGMCIELPIKAEKVVDSLGDKVRIVIDENEYLSNIERVIDKVANIVENPFAEAAPSLPEATKTDFVPHEHKPDQYESKKHEKPRDSYKKHSSKADSGESKERYRRDKSSEDGSGERYKKSKDYKKYDKRSSEYENARREADGEWHEKMMQHRENIRKTNEKHRHDKNWYIERGDSREQARMGEQKFRGQ